MSVNARKILIHLAAIEIAGAMCCDFALAQDDDSIYGTHAVVFQEIRASGVLNGCTLVYRAVQADHAYLNGNPVVIIGNIGVHQINATAGLALKIGVKDLGVRDAPMQRPYFAYLQIGNSTTATSRYQANDGDDGYKLIAVALDDASTKLLLGMLDAGKVTIGFNRRERGIDVLVPIDLTVFDADILESGKVVRKHSTAAISQFLGCFRTILEQTISKSQK